MPSRLFFKDTELEELYEATEGQLDTGHASVKLKCKNCPKDRPKGPVVYELELGPEGEILKSDRNSLLAHGRAHFVKPRLRRLSGFFTLEAALATGAALFAVLGIYFALVDCGYLR